MSLFIDKYRPKSLDHMHFHEELSRKLKALAKSSDFPHLLVYGIPGSGKKTRVLATLRELYGSGVEKLKIDQKTFISSSNKKIKINIISSNYHLEFTPSDSGNYDRMVIQDLLKEIAQTQQVDTSAKQRFKVVIINESDHLSGEAQAALRRTMEKYYPNLRLILLASSTSKIMAPIQSRCFLVRVSAPKLEEIATILKYVASEEHFSLPDQLCNKIALDSKRNLRRALLMLETIYAKDSNLHENTIVPLPDWETYINQIAESIIQEQTPAKILQVRGMLYELITHCIPPPLILKVLTFNLISKIDDILKPETIKWATFYEHRLQLGNKAIFHLEAFVAKFMRIYSSHYTGFS
ncbi:unnamed protein product [Pneumocystis jirovecii]|uniref:Replication factor C subunit 5 n=2 Tax=Pneumocystis jirovecii TaxID=42068 RepID=L0P7P4_PNEJI|nr:replication factor C subunit 5 [Pneumocystis jirovecii RU7]KTW27853.1 hypothetical protein T551_02820 [Pneumocystis jirovecii RU7]CCJ28396.1 unnamed protein product [Pneumocystis jirovecii]